jgi:hypothetical protein
MKIDNKYQCIKDVPKNNYDLLGEIKNELSQIFKGKREIMYSDIINLIIREGKIGENYNNLILWCNYKIRLGETFVEI